MNNVLPHDFYNYYQPRISEAQKRIRWMNFAQIKKKIYDRYGVKDKWLHELQPHILEDLLTELRNYYRKNK